MRCFLRSSMVLVLGGLLCLMPDAPAAGRGPGGGPSGGPSFGGGGGAPSFGGGGRSFGGSPGGSSFGGSRSFGSPGSSSMRSFGSGGTRSVGPSFGGSSRSFGGSSTPSFNRSTTPSFNRSTTPTFNRSTTPSFNRSTMPSFDRSTTPSNFSLPKSSGPSVKSFSSPQSFSGSRGLSNIPSTARSWDLPKSSGADRFLSTMPGSHGAKSLPAGLDARPRTWGDTWRNLGMDGPKGGLPGPGDHVFNKPGPGHKPPGGGPVGPGKPGGPGGHDGHHHGHHYPHYYPIWPYYLGFDYAFYRTYSYYSYPYYYYCYDDGYYASYPYATYYTDAYLAEQPVDTVDVAPQEAAEGTDLGQQLFAEAVAAFRAGQYDEAGRLTAHALVEMPRDARAHELMSLVLFAQGQYDGAVAEAHAALALGPPADWPTLYAYYGNLKTYTTQLDAMKEYLRKNPSSPTAQFIAAYHNTMMGHKDRAKELFAQVLATAPKDEVARRMIKYLGGTPPPAAVPPAPAPQQPAAEEPAKT